MAAITYPHIEFDQNGTPIVEGTRFKVIQIAMDRLFYDWNAEQIQRQHPSLTLAQIHAALTYYYDHQTEMDAEIERREKEADTIRNEMESDPAYRARRDALRRKIREAEQRA